MDNCSETGALRHARMINAYNQERGINYRVKAMRVHERFFVYGVRSEQKMVVPGVSNHQRG